MDTDPRDGRTRSDPACWPDVAAPADTSCRGTPPDTSPGELSVLAAQVAEFRGSARWYRVRCGVDALLGFVAGHLITIAMVIALLAVATAVLI